MSLKSIENTETNAEKNFSYYEESCNELFSVWQKKENNIFSNCSKKDSRENAYINGKGYLKETAEYSEEHSLKKCYNLVGLAMLFIVFVNTAIRFHISTLKSSHFFIYLKTDDKIHITPLISLSIGVVNVLTYLIPFLILWHMLKLPISLIFRKKICHFCCLKTSIKFALIITSLFLIAENLIFGNASKNIFIDSYNFDPSAVVIMIFFQVVISSIIIELLFRGIILRLFHQFGNYFALIFTTLVSTLVIGSFNEWPLSLIINFLIGYTVIATCSVLSGILVRIVFSAEVILLQFVLKYAPRNIQILAFILLIILAFLYVSHLISAKKMLKIPVKRTAIPMKTKLMFALSRASIIICIFFILIFNIISIGCL